MKFLRGLGLLLLLLLPLQALAQDWPVVTAIRFAGNDTTQEGTMLREMFVHVGEPADPAQVERSRQAIQDLGLFRSVDIATEPDGAGVQLVVTVREKYYVIPAPRADTNSDGQYAYGLQLRWYNAFGLNHTVKATVKQENRQQAGRGTAFDLDAAYYAPFLIGPYGLELSASRSKEPVEDPLPYDEVRTGARALLSRSFHDGLAASQGLHAGIGLQWQRQTTSGELAPPPQGQATALVLGGSYSDRHYHLYSESGWRAGMELQSTVDNGALSDYDYTSVVGDLDASWYVGDTPHQTVALFAQAGAYHGGPEGGASPYQLGGSGDLRGYRHNFLAGDTYYYGGLEYLRPIYWDWLRGVAFFEAGNTFAGDSNATLEHSYADVGLGLRLRATWFVNFELNVGMALPLVDAGDGTGARFFATGRR